MLVAILIAPVALAQDPRPLNRTIITGESKGLTQRLEEIEKLVPAKWSEALVEYARLIDESGDDLVPRPEAAEDLPVSVQVRRWCQSRMALAPPELLRPYQDRFDRTAKRWLDEGLKNRDAAPLRRIASESLHSQQAQKGLDTLGDLAFERGRFEEAIQWWRLAPPSPDSHAKRILAHIFAGEQARAEKELKDFPPDAAGHLAGRKGKYVEILGDWIKKLDAGKLALDEADWRTFGGDPSRNRVFAQSPSPRLWAEGPAWGLTIETGERFDCSSWAPPHANSHSARRLAYHPLIVGDKILLAGSDWVTAFHLQTGNRVFRYQHRKAPFSENTADVRYTLTATTERIYARLGALALSLKKEADERSHLVCLDIRDGKALWSIEAKGSDGEPAFFEGAPVEHDGRVYIALSRLVAGRTISAIACYEGLTGAPVWQRDVCEAPEFEGSESRVRHYLLTLAGTNLVYCSNSGAVIALDSVTGGRQWALRYPSRGLLTQDRLPSPRDLCPPLFSDGRVFVAPVDADRLICVDALDGKVLWQREHIEVLHLLGAIDGVAYVNTTRGLQAIRTDTGLDDGGWRPPASDAIRTFGRGFLAGGIAYWPTQLDIAFLPASLRHGQPAFDLTQLSRLWGGNTAFANGCVAVADMESLFVYLPPKGLPQKPEASRNPITTQSTRHRHDWLDSIALDLQPKSKNIRLERKGTTDIPPAPVRPKQAWSYDPPMPTTLTGEPLSFFGDDDVRFVVIPRNQGYELDRVDPKTGRSLWKERSPLFRTQIGTVVHDASNVYCVADGALECRSLASGGRVWKARLPQPYAWRLLLEKETLLAYPQDDNTPAWTWTPVADALLCLPRVRTARGSLSLLVYDAATGTLRDQLNFEPVSSQETGLRISQTGPRLIITYGSRTWLAEVLR